MKTFFTTAPTSVAKNNHPTIPESKTFNRFKVLIWTFIVLGFLLRIYHFIDNRSLWIDELYLANSIIRFGFTDLVFSALEYEQKAPIGYLWGTRLMVTLFGKGEMALRLVPLLGGLGALLLFRKVSLHFLQPLGATVAVAILALAPPLVFHGVEAKQYSTELFFTVVALYSYTLFYDKTNVRALLSWGLLGAVILWFSYAAIFVLAGMAFAVCLHYLLNRNWESLFLSIVPFFMWMLSFAINYLFFTSRHTESEWLVAWFNAREGFMPLPPTSMDELLWFFQTPYRLLDYPLGLLWNFEVLNTSGVLWLFKMHWLIFACLGVGLVVAYKRNKVFFMVLLFPVLLTLLASGFKLYPFYERLLVFLAPLLILFIALGCQSFVQRFGRFTKAVHLLPVLLLVAPVGVSAATVLNTSLFAGKKQSSEREGLLYIENKYQQGDVVYIFWNMEHAYRYYQSAYGLTYQVIEGLDVKNQALNKSDYYSRLQPDLEAIARGQRVWVIHHRKLKLNIGDYDHVPAWYHAEETEPGTMLHEKLTTMGNLSDKYIMSDVAVHLYELKKD